MLSSRCGNCAHACLISLKNIENLNLLFCRNFCETVNKQETCAQFISHDDAQFCWLHDMETKEITKYKYPFKNGKNFKNADSFEWL